MPRADRIFHNAVQGGGKGASEGSTGFSADGVKDQPGQREQGGNQHAGLRNNLDLNIVKIDILVAPCIAEGDAVE